jgi:SAM-dependent methyltransferase
MVTKPTHVAHLHLLSVINSEMLRLKESPVVRILDLGCGDGHLIAYLFENLGPLFPSRSIEIYGHDVSDYEAANDGETYQARNFLRERFPSVPWEKFVQMISATDQWPYPDGFFDVIVSNQVLEHLEDMDFFFGEAFRTLKEGGVAANLFPFVHHFQEGHLHLPLVHKIRNFHCLKSMIKVLSAVGLGDFKTTGKRRGMTLDHYSEHYADFLRQCTYYITYQQARALAKKHHLRISLKYSPGFYTQKLRRMLRLGLKDHYRPEGSVISECLSVFILKYISCITMFLEKKDTYARTSESLSA